MKLAIKKIEQAHLARECSVRFRGRTRQATVLHHLPRKTKEEQLCGDQDRGARRCGVSSAAPICVASLRSRSSPILTYNRVRSGWLLPRAL
jgi:hypothetical protein